MSCKRHIHRKRPNSCPDCAAELKGEEKVQTSREMLADLNKMESEEVELVIKKERKAREPKEPKVVEQFPTSEPVVFNCLIEHKDDVDRYFNIKLDEFKLKINTLSTLRYENLYVPMDQFDLKMMDKLNKEKWRLINFWDTNIAKASGIKREVAVLERIVASDNKPKPEFKI